MMKKIYKKTYILSLFLISLIFKSQDNSIASSVLTPVAYQTGVPDVSFPLVSLPAAKDFTLNFGLVYNPNSYKVAQNNGQIARNWTLSGSNFMITRSILEGSPDETLPPYMEWDDVFYYNINGDQGSFKFEKTGTFPNDIYIIKKLTPSNITIECDRIQTAYSWLPRHIQSFKITDSKGYKYYFEDYDNLIILIDSNKMVNSRNTFYVTKIIDQNGRQIATFQNKKYIKFNNNVVESWTFLPESINTNFGKILITHGDSGDSWNVHDRYYLNSFILKDHKDNVISKYELQVSHTSYKYFDIALFQSLEAQTIKERILNKIKKFDKKLNILDYIKFEYNYFNPPHPEWESSTPIGAFTEGEPFLLRNLLKDVYLPSGGRIEYKYGIHTLKLDPPINYNTSSSIYQIQGYDQDGIAPFSYKEKIDSIAFDSKISKIYPLKNLQHSPYSRIYVKFFPNETYPWNNNGPQSLTKGGIPEPDPYLAYKVKNYYKGSSSEIEALYSTPFVVTSTSNPFLEIKGSGGNGWFEIYEKFWSEPPYTILNSGVSNTGVKIEEIKFYDRDTTPYGGGYKLQKTINFDYTFFNEPGVSSGIAVPDLQQETIIYRNIKVTESDKLGYSKYYYKTSWNYPHYSYTTNPYSSIWPNYNLTKKGLLDKKEIFNSNNNLVYSFINSYNLPEVDISKIYKVELVCEICNSGADSGPFYTQESFPEKITTTETNYDLQGNSLSTISEKTFNQENNNQMTTKNITAEGITLETNYQYAAEKGNAKLIGASMFSVPLEVTQKQDGIVTGKIETFYNHSDNYFPSSLKSTGINNTVINENKNDIYDEMGNVLQTTSITGIPTAYIYGYNGTLLIAKVEGAKYKEVMSAFGLPNTNQAYKSLEIYTASNQDVDDASEENLRQKLDDFRLKQLLKDYHITTYTHDPLIGMKSISTSSGMKEYYYYDSANQLIRVEDINHNVIKKNEYKTNVLTIY